MESNATNYLPGKKKNIKGSMSFLYFLSLQATKYNPNINCCNSNAAGQNKNKNKNPKHNFCAEKLKQSSVNKTRYVIGYR